MFSWLFGRRSARPGAAHPAQAPATTLDDTSERPAPLPPDEPMAAPEQASVLAAQPAPEPERSPETAPIAPPELDTAEPAIDASALVERALAEGEASDAVRGQMQARWREIEARQQSRPLDEPAWIGFIGDLRRRRLRETAFILTGLLDEALPKAAWPSVERAGLCGPQTPPATMLAIGERAFAMAPELPAGPRLMAHALRLLGRPDDAAALLARLPETYASQDWYLITALHLAAAKGDHARVIDLAARLRAVAPGRSMGFTMGSTAHRQRNEFAEAEAIVQQAMTALPGMMDVWNEAARVAQAREAHDEAFERWGEMRRRFPQSPAGYLGAIQLSQRVGQAEETDLLIAEALAAHPDDRDVRMHAARGALQTEDVAAAELHWQAAIDAAPHDAALALRAALSLLGNGATRKARIKPTVERLAELSRQFPDHVPIGIAHLRLLRYLGRLDEAKQVAADWAERFPDYPKLAIARARLAESAGDSAGAIRTLEELRDRAPPSGQTEAAYVRVLSVAGQHERAEAVCEAALQAYPTDRDVLCEYSAIAMRAGDWALALRRAHAGLAARPGDGALKSVIQRARLQVVPGDEDAADEASALLEDAPSETAESKLLSRFESLGATAAGCEFGLVQRRFGCEPLGLLRWAKIDLDGLVGALGDEFAGIGTAENTQLLIRAEDEDHQEYYVEDRRLGYSTHTFVKVEDTSFDRMLAQSLRRLTFLRAKLIEDLRAGEKVFVYKLGAKFSDESGMRRLFDAVRAYGDNVLLCVTMADDAHPVGTLRMLEPGLFAGYVGTFMGVGRAGAAGIDMQRWRSFCEQVVAWRDTVKQAA